MSTLTREDVTAGMLAQARGCEPDNPCHGECCLAAQEALDEDRDAAVTDDLLEWINSVTWSP